MDLASVSRTYARWAPFYDRTFGSLTSAGRRRAVDHINARGGEVLELGVGTGLSLGGYAAPAMVTGIDFSHEMLDKARDKVASMGRFVARYEALPAHIKARLVLENDDRIYTPADLLPLCARTGLPFVYDVHHHRCHPDGQSIEAVTEQALATWLREPLFHLSSPRDGWQGANPRPHHDYIDPGDLPACWAGRQLTVEVEAKAKELALQRLIAAQAPRAATP